MKKHLPSHKVVAIDTDHPYHPASDSQEDYEEFFDRVFEVLVALKYPTLVGLTEIFKDERYYSGLLLDDSNPKFFDHLKFIQRFAPKICYKEFTGEVDLMGTKGGSVNVTEPFQFQAEEHNPISAQCTPFLFPKSGEMIIGQCVQGGHQSGTLGFFSRRNDGVLVGVSTGHLYWQIALESHPIQVSSGPNIFRQIGTTQQNMRRIQHFTYLDVLGFSLKLERNQRAELALPLRFADRANWRTFSTAWSKGSQSGRSFRLTRPEPIRAFDETLSRRAPILGFRTDHLENDFGVRGDSGSVLIFSTADSDPFVVEDGGRFIAGIFFGVEHITNSRNRRSNLFTSVWQLASELTLESFGSLAVNIMPQ